MKKLTVFLLFLLVLCTAYVGAASAWTPDEIAEHRQELSDAGVSTGEYVFYTYADGGYSDRVIDRRITECFVTWLDDRRQGKDFTQYCEEYFGLELGTASGIFKRAAWTKYNELVEFSSADAPNPSPDWSVTHQHGC